MRVILDPDICVGSGVCVQIDDVIFTQDEDRVVRVLVGKLSARQELTAADAVRMCPTGALSVVPD